MAERMARHGFGDRPCRTVADAAAHTVAVQAQDLGQARLGIRARTPGPSENDVTTALNEARVVRTWLMRSTIHLVAADDLRWLTALLGPSVRRRNAARWAELGLTPRLLGRIEQLAPDLLADGPLTRHEFADALRARGVALAAGQAMTHVLVHLAAIGMTCHADRDRFTRVERWAPHAVEGPRGDEALAELARRYFSAFAPATPADFTAWSGLPSAAAIALIRDELEPVEVHGRRGYRRGPAVAATGLRLVSGFDNYLVGYRDRTGLIADARRGEVYVGGIIRPTLLRDGVIVGRWRLDRAKGRIAMVAFDTLSRRDRAGLEAEVADLERFVGRALTLSVDT